MAVRALPDVLVLQVRRRRGDCPVFQHGCEKGVAGVRDHLGLHSGRVPLGGYCGPPERVSEAGPAGSGNRDRECRSGLATRSEEHTSELQSLAYLVCRLLLEKKKKNTEAHR